MAQKKRWFSERKKILAIAVAAILIFAAVGGTIAYMVASTQQMENRFVLAQVTCAATVNSNGTASVQNTGDVDAYIRADITLNWEKDNVVYPPQPDCTVTVNTSLWALHTDGYYYTTEPVAPGASVSLITAVSNGTNSPGSEYDLKITVLADAIQAAGVNGSGQKAACDAWGVDPAALRP